jgi:hypothetical protein
MIYDSELVQLSYEREQHIEELPRLVQDIFALNIIIRRRNGWA